MMWYGLLASTIMNDTSVAENVTSFGIYWQHIREVARGTSSFLGQTAVAFERPLSSPIMLFLAAIAPAIVVTALVYYASIDRVQPSGSAPSTKPTYEVETDDRGRSKITFGDGPTGATPPSREAISQVPTRRRRKNR